MSSADIAVAAPPTLPSRGNTIVFIAGWGSQTSAWGWGSWLNAFGDGWNAQLRDLAYRAAFQHYVLALTLYVLMLLIIGKVLGFGLDYLRISPRAPLPSFESETAFLAQG